eukprot:CAMPEP_0114493064 /NCGR_PEP_ID=MMETSP0109-20121206/3906_1 /TAXON_ID=29199 /ORGANISM="Chlorarachnion reptans, Strain CCCM449" /LENGTH=669 /DNA_ID=CAMNT_0001669983 /DNA_START=147 /DNA_END=2156 /DNA_ORIENTATION=+
MTSSPSLLCEWNNEYQQAITEKSNHDTQADDGILKRLFGQRQYSAAEALSAPTTSLSSSSSSVSSQQSSSPASLPPLQSPQDNSEVPVSSAVPEVSSAHLTNAHAIPHQSANIDGTQRRKYDGDQEKQSNCQNHREVDWQTESSSWPSAPSSSSSSSPFPLPQPSGFLPQQDNRDRVISHLMEQNEALLAALLSSSSSSSDASSLSPHQQHSLLSPPQQHIRQPSKLPAIYDHRNFYHYDHPPSSFQRQLSPYDHNQEHKNDRDEYKHDHYLSEDPEHRQHHEEFSTAQGNVSNARTLETAIAGDEDKNTMHSISNVDDACDRIGEKEILSNDLKDYLKKIITSEFHEAFRHERDEAEDLRMLQFRILQRLNNTNNFSIDPIRSDVSPSSPAKLGSSREISIAVLQQGNGTDSKDLSNSAQPQQIPEAIPFNSPPLPRSLPLSMMDRLKQFVPVQKDAIPDSGKVCNTRNNNECGYHRDRDDFFETDQRKNPLDLNEYGGVDDHFGECNQNQNTGGIRINAVDVIDEDLSNTLNSVRDLPSVFAKFRKEFQQVFVFFQSRLMEVSSSVSAVISKCKSTIATLQSSPPNLDLRGLRTRFDKILNKNRNNNSLAEVDTVHRLEIPIPEEEDVEACSGNLKAVDTGNSPPYDTSRRKILIGFVSSITLTVRL